METVLQMLTNLATFMFVASLKGSVLIVLVLAAQKIFGKVLPANWRHALWFVVVVGLATPVGYEAALLPPAPEAEPPSPPALESATEMHPDTREDSASVIDTSPRVSLAMEARVDMPSRPGRLPSVPDAMLPLLWLAGVVAVLGAIARSGHRFARLVQRARPASDALHSVLRECAARTGCRLGVALLHSDDVDVPMIAGQFNPVLLLPTGLEHQLTHAQLRHVFIHELMHLQRGDIAGNWIVAFVQALHWFNPLVWYAFQRMRQDRELACDAATLRHLSPAETAAYGHTLLQLNDMPPAMRIPAIALGMLHDSSALHQRIRMLAQPPRAALLPVTAAIITMLPLVALAFSQPVPAVHDQVSDAGASQAVAGPSPAANAPQPTADLAVPAASVVIDESAAPELTAPVAQQSVAETDAVTIPSVDAGSIAVDRTPESIPAPRSEAAAASRTTPVITDIPVTTAPPTPVLAAINTAPEESAPVMVTPAAPYGGLVEIERMAHTFATIKAGKLAFIEKWNEIGAACDARKERFLGVLSASCQRIRTAQRRGEIFRFAYECYQLIAIHEGLAADYRRFSALQREPRAEEALRNNTRELAAICSEDTYANHYPAFAAMFADAGTLTYHPHVAATTMVQRRTFASFGDVFFHQDRAGGNTGLGTGGAYSPGYPNPDTVVPGIFGSGIPAGGAVVAPTPLQ